MHSNSHSHKLGEIVSRDPVGRVGETRLGRQAPGSIAARRAEGRGRRGPPAARRPSRCRGTASSTLQQQPSKRTISQPQWQRTPGSAPDRARSRALRLCERGSGHIHARTHNRRRTRAQRRNGARQTRGADARARTFLVEVVVLLHDERLRHGCGCGCCRGDARAGGRPSRRREGVSPGPGRWPRWIWSGGGAELTGMEKRAAWI
jgi:hypothetical protein